MSSLSNAMKYVRDHKYSKEGVVCPCCEQKAKAWKKTLVSTAVADLCSLVSMYDGNALHISDFTTTPQDRNFSQLVLWGLVSSAKNEDSKKRASGRWFPTQRGISFARGRIRISQYVVTYNNEVIKFEGDLVSVRDVIGNKFDYGKLIGNQTVVI